MADVDAKVNEMIRAFAGQAVAPRQGEELDDIDRRFNVDAMSESERRLYEEWRRGPGMKSDGDVNAWIRGQAGRVA